MANVVAEGVAAVGGRRGERRQGVFTGDPAAALLVVGGGSSSSSRSISICIA